MAGTIGAAEDIFVIFNTMAYYTRFTVKAFGRQHVNGAFKTIKHVVFIIQNNCE